MGKNADVIQRKKWRKMVGKLQSIVETGASNKQVVANLMEIWEICQK